MSSYLGPNYIPKIEVPDYQPSVSLDMLSTVGSALQGQYDQRHTALQGQVDALGKYPIIKPSDRDYISQKMSDLVGNLNQYANKDLGDSKVYNQMLGMTSSIYNDSDLYTRITSNQAAVTQLKKIQKTKDENPEQYSPNNEHVFNKKLDQWMSDPKKLSFNAKYTPFYDDSEERNDIADRILENPDIKYGHVTDPITGKTRAYTEQEIKEVTQKRLLEGFQSGLSDKSKAQSAIDYEADMDKPQYSIQSALAETGGTLSFYDNNIQQLKTLLPTVKNKLDYKKVSDEIDNLQGERDAYNDKRNKLKESGDASQYFTFSNYNDDKLSHIAKSLTYRQEGKPSYDELFKIDYQEKAHERLARLKASLQHAMATEPGAVNTYNEGLKNLHVDGEAEFKPSDVYAMQNFNGKVQGDGSIDATIGGKNQLIDVQPTLQRLGVDVDKSKVTGYDKLLTDYNKWIKTDQGRIIQGDKPNPIDDEFAYEGNNHVMIKPKSFDEFLTYLNNSKSTTGHSLLQDFTNTYKWDPSNPDDLSKIKKITSDTKEMALMGTITSMLGDANINGTMNLVPQDGTNTIIGSEGTPHNKFYLQVPYKDLATRFGENGVGNAWGLGGDKGVDLMIKQGIFKQAGYPKKSNGEDITEKGHLYQVPITIPVTRNLRETSADIVNHDHVMSKHPGVYQEQVDNTIDLLTFTQRRAQNDIDVMKAPPDRLGELAESLIGGFMTTGKLNKVYEESYVKQIKDWTQMAKDRNNTTSIIGRAKLKAIISSISVEDMINKLNFVNSKSAPLKVTTKPTDNAYQDTEE